jgi:hypothetical protein
MKYFGEPNLHVIDYKKCKEVFCFDENGEFETKDPKLIEWMKKNKNFIRCENNVADDKPTEEQIRALAKEKGIRNWHNMKIEKLIEKLKE